jgi:hypothetical protein
MAIFNSYVSLPEGMEYLGGMIYGILTYDILSNI